MLSKLAFKATPKNIYRTNFMQFTYTPPHTLWISCLVGTLLSQTGSSDQVEPIWAHMPIGLFSQVVDPSSSHTIIVNYNNSFGCKEIIIFFKYHPFFVLTYISNLLLLYLLLSWYDTVTVFSYLSYIVLILSDVIEEVVIVLFNKMVKVVKLQCKTIILF